MYPVELAEVYDTINVDGNGKNYTAEAERLTTLVRARLPDAASLLDVACGTGAHLAHLRHAFGRVAGVEVSEPMRTRAAERLPGVPVYAGDLRTFNLETRFDVVTCLFSSIGYVAGLAELHQAAARMAAHLNPAGVLVIEPWLGPDQWRDGHVSCIVARTQARTVVRMSYSSRDGRTSRMRIHYLVGEPGRGARHFQDEHVMSLFTTKEYEQAVAASGLIDVEWVDGWSKGRDLLLARRPAD
jgi:SAM-dependent methyltransferase